MAKLAHDVMTADPACCSPETTLDQVAKMMAQNDCGQIPVIDTDDRPLGVVTDRDIVCRVVAEEKNPAAHTAGSYMTTPAVTVRSDAPIDEVVATMEEHKIRRVLVTDGDGACVGIIAQADIAGSAPPRRTSELVTEISKPGR